MTRMYREPEKKKQCYEPLELPDQQVLFAESLENLSMLNQEDPLAYLRETPTPSDYSRVAEWEYLDPNLNYAIRSGGDVPDENVNVQLIPPVFERADLFNDGPAILSACLRYWGVVENQYHISQMIHPDRHDPFVSLDELEHYVTSKYPEFMSISRLNGSQDILVNLLKADIPVIVLVQRKATLSFWLNDDRLEGRYYLILGYSSENDMFSFQDTANGNTLKISSSDLMSDWYVYQRQYLIIYPAEKDEKVQEALSEDYFEELNLQRAMAKFRTDSELLPDNSIAQYNCAVLLHLDGDNGGAWELFQKALELGMPQRYNIYQSDLLRTALDLGCADDLEEYTLPMLERFSHDDILTLYRGWAYILRKDYKKGSDFFEKASQINPNNEKVLYALKYRDTMLNY